MPNNQDELEKIENRIAQLRAQKKAIKQKEKLREKQERTRRLIGYGELVETYLGCKNMPLDKFEELLIRILNTLKESKSNGKE